jgi:hypothetical protein
MGLNQTFEQYLHVYCSDQQDNWLELLPLGEFTYNNALAASTGVSPFFANKGYHPNTMVYPECELTSQKARDFVDELHTVLHQQLMEAQEHYQGPADCCHSPAPDFQIGQQVFIRAEFIRTTSPSKKLAEKYLRPFDIIACPSTHSFTLQLPEQLHSIHPIFHVLQLELAIPNEIPNHTQSPPPLVEVEGELEYKISEILDTKINNHHRCKLLYYVCWAGYEGTDEETSWLPATELKHTQEPATDPHACYPGKPSPLTT